MDDNPYASPQAEQQDVEYDRRSVDVDGKYLVVRNNVVLPARCVVTNEPTQPNAVIRVTLKWAPSFRLVISRHRCRVTYSLSKREWRRVNFYRMFDIAMGTALGAMLGGVVGASILGAFGCAVAFVRNRGPLQLRRAERGHYWLLGCGEPFLNSIREESTE